jgi:hypothetical protein
MHSRGGGGVAECGADAAGTAATIATGANADLFELDSPASGLLPPAAHCLQHRPGEEDRQDEQATRQ